MRALGSLQGCRGIVRAAVSPSAHRPAGRAAYPAARIAGGAISPTPMSKRKAGVALAGGSDAAELFGIDDSAKAALVEDALVWAAQNGLSVGLGGDNPDAATIHAPMCLLPTPIPRSLYEQGVAIAQDMNDMVDRISLDGEYLESALAGASQFDDFTARLLEIYRATRVEAAEQPLTLGLHRSDYMLDAPSQRLLQVELNTMAASFGCLSTLVSRMHEHLLGRAGLDVEASCLPENKAMEGLAGGLAAAVREYGVEGAVVMTVVQPGEKNAYDQEWLSAELWKQARIRVVRKSLKQIEEQGALTADRRLKFGDTEVAVAYMRAGYTPDDYPTEIEWAGRLKMERSTAVKCPNIEYHLTGSKKVQQDLARPGVLEKFIPDAQKAARVRESFAGLWALDDDGADDIIAKALADPGAYVLKPQREGGGNNLYGDELVERLGSREGLGAFILMQRIRPPEQSGILLRRGEATPTETLSELGIYQVYLKRGDEVLVNEAVGHLLRTKTSSSDEGGVAAGFAVLDSPYLEG